MPDNNKVRKYFITTADKVTHEVSKSNFDKYGAKGYAEDYPQATIYMFDKNGDGWEVDLNEYDQKRKEGYKLAAKDYTVKPQTTKPATAPRQKVSVESNVKQATGNTASANNQAASKKQETESPGFFSSLWQGFGSEAAASQLGQEKQAVQEKENAIEQKRAKENAKINEQRRKAFEKNNGTQLLKLQKRLLERKANPILSEVEDKVEEITESVKNAITGGNPVANKSIDIASKIVKNNTGIGMVYPVAKRVFNWVGGWFNGDMRRAQTAVDKINDTLDLIDEVHTEKKSGWTNKNVGGFYRGLIDQGSKISNWDFGISDMTQDITAANVVQKYINGEQLTASEQSLLDVIAFTGALDEAYGSEVGRAYKAGQGTATSLGYMEAFALNPAAGMAEGVTDSALRAGAKAALKEGTKRAIAEAFGKGVIKGAGKGLLNTGKNILNTGIKLAGKEGMAVSYDLAEGGTKAALMRSMVTRYGEGVTRAYINSAKFVGDALQAAALESTTGLPATISNIEKRRTGNVKSTDISAGTGKFAGVDNVESTGDAIKHGIISNYFEYWSEGFGDYFSALNKALKSGKAVKATTKGAAKADNTLFESLPKMKAALKSKFGDRFEGMMALASNDDIGRMVNSLKDKVKFNGFAGEWGEEVVNNVMNAIPGLTGDMNFSTDPNSQEFQNSVFNPDTNIDLILQIACMCGHTYALEGGSAMYRTNQMNKAYHTAENVLDKSFGEDAKDIKANLDLMGAERSAEYIQQLATQGKLNNQAKLNSVLTYSFVTNMRRGLNTRSAILSGNQSEDGVQKDYEDAYKAGYGMDATGYRQSKQEYETADQMVKESLSESDYNTLQSLLTDKNTTDHTLRAFMSAYANGPKATPEGVLALENYVNAYSRQKGVSDWIDNSIDTDVNNFRESFQPAVDGTNNTVTLAQYKDPDTQETDNVFVVSGPTDGTGASTAVIIKDDEMQMVPSSTLTPAAVYDADEYEDMYRNQASSAYSEYYSWMANNNILTQRPTEGLQFSVYNEEGGNLNTYVVTGQDDQTGKFLVNPVSYKLNPETKEEEKVIGEDPVMMDEDQIIAAQNDYYDTLDALDKKRRIEQNGQDGTTGEDGTQSEQPVNDTDDVVVGSEETGGSTESKAIREEIAGLAGGNDALADYEQMRGNGYSDAELRNYIKGAITDNYGNKVASLVESYHNALNTEAAATASPTSEANDVASTTAQEGFPVDADGNVDFDAIEKTGNVDTMVKALTSVFGDAEKAHKVALNSKTVASKELKKATDKGNLTKMGKFTKSEKFWGDVVNALWEQIKPQDSHVQGEEVDKSTLSEDGKAVKDKWDNAPKHYGRPRTITLPDGTEIRGRYVLYEEGSATPSHNPFTWEPNPGTTDENGETNNSRDYKDNPENQRTVERNAANYDSRALTNPPIIFWGRFMSGNGTDMSGQIAAKNNTDGKYLTTLKRDADFYGFTSEQTEEFTHPRIGFEIDEDSFAEAGLDFSPLSYDRFNSKADMKQESAIEKGIKMGKVLTEDTFKKLADLINRHPRLRDVYASKETQEAIANLFVDAPEVVDVSKANVSQYYDSAAGKLTEDGRQLLEAALIGHLFKGNAETLKELNDLDKKVMTEIADGMPELSQIRQNKDYDISDEIAKAIHALWMAKQSGMTIQDYLSQQDVFAGGAGMQVHGATVGLLARLMSGTENVQLPDSETPVTFKSVLQSYLGDVESSQGSFMPMTKDESLRSILSAIYPDVKFEEPTTEEEQPAEEQPQEEQPQEEQPAEEQPQEEETQEEQSQEEQPQEEQPTEEEQSQEEQPQEEQPQEEQPAEEQPQEEQPEEKGDAFAEAERIKKEQDRIKKDGEHFQNGEYDQMSDEGLQSWQSKRAQWIPEAEEELDEERKTLEEEKKKLTETQNSIENIRKKAKQTVLDAIARVRAITLDAKIEKTIKDKINKFEGNIYEDAEPRKVQANLRAMQEYLEELKEEFNYLLLENEPTEYDEWNDFNECIDLLDDFIESIEDWRTTIKDSAQEDKQDYVNDAASDILEEMFYNDDVTHNLESVIRLVNQLLNGGLDILAEMDNALEESVDAEIEVEEGPQDIESREKEIVENTERLNKLVEEMNGLQAELDKRGIQYDKVDTSKYESSTEEQSEGQGTSGVGEEATTEEEKDPLEGITVTREEAEKAYTEARNNFVGLLKKRLNGSIIDDAVYDAAKKKMEEAYRVFHRFIESSLNQKSKEWEAKQAESLANDPAEKERDRIRRMTQQERTDYLLSGFEGNDLAIAKAVLRLNPTVIRQLINGKKSFSDPAFNTSNTKKVCSTVLDRINTVISSYVENKNNVRIEEVKRMFDLFNTDESGNTIDPEMKEIFDKVYSVMRMAGLSVRLIDNNSNIGGDAFTNGLVQYGSRYLYSPDTSNEYKRNLILHELIHTATQHALYANPKASKKIKERHLYMLTPEMEEAASELIQIYAEVRKNTGAGRLFDSKADYGSTSEHEMTADMFQMRPKLERLGLWRRFLDAVHKFFFGENTSEDTSDMEKVNAFQAVKDALDKMLSNFMYQDYEYLQLTEGNTRIRRSDAQKVFHGSGSKFDKFRESFLNSGTGAQAYGYGIYLAQNESTAKGYTHGPNRAIVERIAELRREREAEVKRIEERIASLTQTQQTMLQNGETAKADVIGKKIQQLNDVLTGVASAENNSLLPIDEAIAENEEKLGSYFYEVEIPDNDGTNYFEYGIEQPVSVLERIRDAASEHEAPEYKMVADMIQKHIDNNDSTLSLLNEIAQELGVPFNSKKVSELLSEAGFVGTKVNDVAYVVYNVDDAKITSVVDLNEGTVSNESAAPKSEQDSKEERLRKIAEKNRREILPDIDKRIEEILSQEKQQSLKSTSGNFANRADTSASHSPEGAQSVADSNAKLGKIALSSKELAKKIAKFINEFDESGITEDNFTKKLYSSLGFTPRQQDSNYVFYFDGENTITLRLSNHRGDARNIIVKGIKTDKGYSIVIITNNSDLSAKSKVNDWADVNEYVYDHPNKKQMKLIAKSLFGLLDSNTFNDFAGAKDRVISPREEIERIKNDAMKRGYFMKAPNGKRSNLHERQWLLVRTSVFKAMFGDWENDPAHSTKVLDENGEPLVVYHGSDIAFNEFDPKKIGKRTDSGYTGKGFYFSTFKGADRYRRSTHGVTSAYFLDIKNPLVVTGMHANVGTLWGSRTLKEAKKRLEEWKDFFKKAEYEELKDKLTEDYLDWINSHDGVIRKGTNDDSVYSEYIVNDPTAIKSAKETTYDDNNDEIPISKRFNRESKDTRFMSGQESTPDSSTASEREKDIQDTANALNTPVTVIHSEEELDALEGMSDADKAKMKKEGMAHYDSNTGRVIAYLPHIGNTEDAVMAVLHEVVGHKGIRGLFGKEEFDSAMRALFNSLPQSIKAEVVSLANRSYNGDTIVAMDEYLSQRAQKDETPTWWQKVKAAIKGLIREKFGLDIEVSDNDIKYLLWQSKNQLRKGDILGEAAQRVMRNRLGINIFNGTENDPNTPDGGPSGTTRNSGSRFMTINQATESDDVKRYFDNILNSARLRTKESMVDFLAPVKAFQDLAEKVSGKPIRDSQDVDRIMASLNSKDAAQGKYFDGRFGWRLGKAIAKIVGNDSNWERESKGKAYYLNRYAAAKHGIERNRDMAVLQKIRENSETEFNDQLEIYEADIQKERSRILSEIADKMAERKNLQEQADNAKAELDRLKASHANKDDIRTQSELWHDLNQRIEENVSQTAPLRKELTKQNEKIRDIEAFPNKYNLKTFDQIWQENLDKWQSAVNNTRQQCKQDKKTWRETQEALDQLATDRFGADLSQEFSGLSDPKSGTFREEIAQSGKDARTVAYDWVEEYESQHDAKDLEELWDAIRAVTSFALTKQWETGLVDQDYVENNLRRFEFFVPLRGFESKSSAEMYDYLSDSHYEQGSPVKRAKGRSSEPGNVFANMIDVALRSISAGNRNLAKQALLNLVEGHDTKGVAVVDTPWLFNFGTTRNPDWQLVEQDDERLEQLGISPLHEGDTPEEIARKMEQFNAKMEEMRKIGMAKHEMNGQPNPPYRIVPTGNKMHHCVLVKIGGKNRVITFTTNPRVAMAVNGELNPDSGTGLGARAMKRLNNFMASAFTANNISFSAANLVRDTMHSNARAFIMEDFEYWQRFTANQEAMGLVAKNKTARNVNTALSVATLGATQVAETSQGVVRNWGKMMALLADYEMATEPGDARHPKLKKGFSKLIGGMPNFLTGVSAEDKALFKQFMDNGGATGYTLIRNEADCLEFVSDMLEGLEKHGIEKFWDFISPKQLFELSSFLGESSELVNRFIAFKTSRQMGRSITRSISDAKEITLNFSRKGSGAKGATKIKLSVEDHRAEAHGLKEGTKAWIGYQWNKLSENSRYHTINAMSSLSQFGRNYLVFWNAHIQGSYQLYDMLMHHGAKSTLKTLYVYGGSMAVGGGMIMPLLNTVLLPAFYGMLGCGGGDDDEDAYYDELSDWERQHNLCFKLPKNYGWAKIPLTPELSANYALGDAIYASMAGKHEFDYLSDGVGNFASLIEPTTINYNDGVMGATSFVPSALVSGIHIAMNKDFRGNPLRKEYQNNQYDPEFKKVYRSASPTLVALSRWLNSKTGGDDYHSGKLDVNPASLKEFLTGFAGGYATTSLALSDFLFSDDKSNFDERNIPIWGRFHVSGSTGHINEQIRSLYYRDAKTFYNKTENVMNKIEADYEKAENGKDDQEFARMKKVADDFYSSYDFLKYDKMIDDVQEVDSYLKEYGDGEMPDSVVETMRELIDLSRQKPSK